MNKIFFYILICLYIFCPPDSGLADDGYSGTTYYVSDVREMTAMTVCLRLRPGRHLLMSIVRYSNAAIPGVPIRFMVPILRRVPVRWLLLQIQKTLICETISFTGHCHMPTATMMQGAFWQKMASLLPSETIICIFRLIRINHCRKSESAPFCNTIPANNQSVNNCIKISKSSHLELTHEGLILLL